MEYRVRSATVRFFRERGTDVYEISTDLSEKWSRAGDWSVNNNKAIAIEVKSKLDKEDVDEHLERLGKFKELLPRYQLLTVLGAVAAMIVPDYVASYTYRQGFFVITQSGDDLQFLNDDKFCPNVVVLGRQNFCQ